MLPERKKLPHNVPPWVPDGAIFFITICCRPKGTDYLCTEGIAHGIFETVEFRQQNGSWFVHLMLLMPDHIHTLVAFPQDRSMKSTVAQWKEYTAKKLGIRWQRDFFDHRLRREESYTEKAHYIRQNPIRKGLVKEPTQWPFVWEPR